MRRTKQWSLAALGVAAWLTNGAGAARAQEANAERALPPGITLTTKEIQDGWIQLFDGATTFGWQPVGNASAWTVTGDALVSPTEARSQLATTADFADFELRAEVMTDGKASPNLSLYYPEMAGRAAMLYGVTVPTGAKYANRWLPVRLRVEGKQGAISIGDRRGKISIPSEYLGEARKVALSNGKTDGAVQFRHVALRPLKLNSLFNGKDFTGWKPIEGHASVFSVTPEGWLNIKNGNGEIQTTQTFGNFVLQFSVYSNGNHLNSGVFSREDPGDFWGGYEDQIRHQWQGTDRNKAFDFGTGGLYFYQPARRVVGTDREWTTMTLVANGRHFASWVNGYLVADWTDPRPETKSNARSGARLKPGVFGFQGHDPTTDLTFRNIQAVELPQSAPAPESATK